ncbi:MAG TPA: hypothetical protein VF550_18100 [Polyangia bacterium]
MTRVLHDGEILQLGQTSVEVFAMPGHTPGSAAFLIRGALLLGDSAESSSQGQLEAATWLFCANRPTNRVSLRTLAQRLAARRDQVKALACSHSGVLQAGLAPLDQLAARLSL